MAQSLHSCNSSNSNSSLVHSIVHQISLFPPKRITFKCKDQHLFILGIVTDGNAYNAIYSVQLHSYIKMVTYLKCMQCTLYTQLKSQAQHNYYELTGTNRKRQ